jgi:hypothetical protein
VSIIHGGVAIGDFDSAPAFERREQHEEVGGAIALIPDLNSKRALALGRH